ncbi:MAG: GH3 auxin-responsive promoter family protein [Saprospiraceae bacterium]|nr:GH3 auxin-responsive promoter family protein [Saprospiraceae bacterium]
MARFVTMEPYRITVSGRTKHFINVFGEEVMVHNTDQAIKETCHITDAIVSDYTVAPVFMENQNKGGHEW